ncbi:MAG: hypothetical protein IM638_01030 [Bacteroidetes bacterium]|nr:hypothetical protein [Bacteroidota bacterium]
MRYLLLVLVIAFTACKRDNSRMVTVNVKQASGSATCTISYTQNVAGTEVQTTSSATSWTSPVRRAEPGEFMKAKVSSTSPQYSFLVTIYVDGGIWKQGTLQSPQGEIVLSGEIPAQ